MIPAPTYRPFDMYGEFVRKVRLSHQMSQQTLAEIAGVSPSTVSACERGRRIPTADTLNRLLVACGYELGATSGDQTIYCALPKAGWFPAEDLPPRVEGDPPDERCAVSRRTPVRERARMLSDVLDQAAAVRR